MKRSSPSPAIDFWSFWRTQPKATPASLRDWCGWCLSSKLRSKSTQWVLWCGTDTGVLSSWSKYCPSCVVRPTLFWNFRSWLIPSLLRLTKHHWGSGTYDVLYRSVCSPWCSRLRVCSCTRSAEKTPFCNSCRQPPAYASNWRTATSSLLLSFRPRVGRRARCQHLGWGSSLKAADPRGIVCRWKKGWLCSLAGGCCRGCFCE